MIVIYHSSHFSNNFYVHHKMQIPQLDVDTMINWTGSSANTEFSFHLEQIPSTDTNLTNQANMFSWC